MEEGQISKLRWKSHLKYSGLISEVLKCPMELEPISVRLPAIEPPDSFLPFGKVGTGGGGEINTVCLTQVEEEKGVPVQWEKLVSTLSAVFEAAGVGGLPSPNNRGEVKKYKFKGNPKTVQIQSRL